MTVWGALAGGFVGTAVLTSTLRLAQETGLTRMDIPLLLGTAFSGHRKKALMIGYAVHFANGLVFAGAYAFVFWAVGHAGIAFGAALGIVHALFAAGVLVNVLLPSVHPRMGTRYTDSRRAPVLEPPGFMLRNYGRHTVFVTAAAHVLYGALVGWFGAGLAVTP